MKVRPHCGAPVGIIGMPAQSSLLEELNNALVRGSAGQRSEILRKVTDLFLVGAEGYSAEQIGLFDDVIGHLTQKIERAALSELSDKLAPVDRAPVGVIGQLARHDDLSVSGPVLEKSNVLTDADLIDIAVNKSQQHMLAIAGRTQISEVVTDVLVDRGNTEVTQKVAGNHGARLSELGMTKVFARAEQDEKLAAAIAARRDVPPQMFDQLLLKATEAVRNRLLENADPEMRERIARTVSTIARKVSQTNATRAPAANSPKGPAYDPEQLKADLSQYATSGRAAETIAAFAALGEVPVELVKNLVRQRSDEGMVILGKAAGLAWPDMRNVLMTTMAACVQGTTEEKQVMDKFLGLSSANAQRAIRFIKAKKAAFAEDVKNML